MAKILIVDDNATNRKLMVTILGHAGHAIISLAHALKLEAVAEGVETEEQAKILHLLRCDQMQGYLISKPLSFDDMTAYLAKSRKQ
jgi:EAL domain-containing protein (putative c-di-GMP-specific phosphodiesterase class I)